MAPCHPAISLLDSYRKVFRAKPVLSKAEGTPRPQRTKSEFRISGFYICSNLASFAPWNTDSTKSVLFSRSAIPPRGIPPRQKRYQFRREVIPRGESSFIRSSPHRAKPVLSPSFVRINFAEGTAKKTFLILLLGVLCVFARVIAYPIP